jgi:hypothetical protein
MRRDGRRMEHGGGRGRGESDVRWCPWEDTMMGVSEEIGVEDDGTKEIRVDYTNTGRTE